MPRPQKKALIAAYFFPRPGRAAVPLTDCNETYVSAKWEFMPVPMQLNRRRVRYELDA